MYVTGSTGVRTFEDSVFHQLGEASVRVAEVSLEEADGERGESEEREGRERGGKRARGEREGERGKEQC